MSCYNRCEACARSKPSIRPKDYIWCMAFSGDVPVRGGRMRDTSKCKEFKPRSCETCIFGDAGDGSCWRFQDGFRGGCGDWRPV